MRNDTPPSTPVANPPVLAWEQSSDGTQRWAFNGGQRFVLTHCYDPKKDDTEWEVEYIPTPHGRITLRYFPTLTAALAECEALAVPTPSLSAPTAHCPSGGAE